MHRLPGTPRSAKDLATLGTRLTGPGGLTVRPQGINLIFKGMRQADGTFHFLPDWPQNLYRRFAALGLNTVRLGILWAAVEPAPGQVDEAYMAFIRSQLDQAAEAGLAVILDMHQDLYAQRFSDGAPDWAVLTQQAYAPTALWSDAYLTSPAVQQAWDAFWENRVVPGTGKGLQDFFADTWAQLAQRFAGHPALLGYDILNEPAPGSEIRPIFAHILASLYNLLSGEEKAYLGLNEAGPEAMAGLFLNPQAKLEALALLDDPERYRLLGDLSEEPILRFERETLEPFYEKVAAAIRRQDQDGFLLRGNNYISNIGVPSGIRPIRVNGRVDARQIFAPHGYDLVVDTEAMQAPSDSRAKSIFARHRETQLALNIPVIVTEWGAFAGYDSALTHGKFLLDLFAAWGWGQTYWCYTEDFFETPAAGLLKAALGARP